MFKTIIDAYNKYILLEDRIERLEKRIETLEKDASPSPFKCPKCDIGKYRPNGKDRLFHGMKVGVQWQCDHCGDIADELKSQRLSKS